MTILRRPPADIFLLIQRPRQLLNHWGRLLGSLDSTRAPTTNAVVAYYDERSEHALLNLQYNEDVFDELARRYVVNVALAAEVGMIQPDLLSEEERKRFLAARLARCTWRCKAQPTVVGALTELARTIEARHPRPAAMPPPPPIRRPSRTPPRGSRPPPCDDEDLVTSPLDVTAFKALAGDKRRPDRIHARYLHGGRWLAARVGAIGLGGATLLTGVPPRVSDQIEVALSFGEFRVIVFSIVVKVSTPVETTAIGAGAFTVKFMLDEHSRYQLPNVLLAARDANVTIEPAPRRAARRFPVAWRVDLGAARGVVKATAVDVSVGGMFVDTDVPLVLDTTVTFSLDEGDRPIAGRARVVRRISDAEAKTSGTGAGFGLTIVAMTEADRTRWSRFLARVERRAEKRVLIGAGPARFAELQAGLASAGYAVISGADPRRLVHLANTNASPADAVLLDARWLQNEPSMAIVEQLVASQNVPCVEMEGDVLRIRQAIDRLLDVQ